MQIRIPSGRKFTLVYLGWVAGWTALHTIVMTQSAGIETRIAIIDAVLSNAFLGVSAIVLLNAMRYYQPGQLLLLTYSIGLAFIAVYSTQVSSTWLVSDELWYQNFFQNTFLLRLTFGWLMIGFISAMAWLSSTLQEHQQLEERKRESESLARQAELASLRQQLQPHFLFNSLNSISALAVSRPEEAREMIQQLSDFLRGTLRTDEQQFVMLSDELAHLQLYLAIEKVRFGHRLKTIIHTDADSQTMKLPTLLIQPIVENAIKFGLYDTLEETTIRLTASAKNNLLEIQVENPFDPYTAAPQKGTGFGLNSIGRRLHLIFGRQDLLTTSQVGNMFITTVRIPQIK